MGVPIGEATGNYPALLECGRCDEQYETDETMFNDCPNCGEQGNFEIVDGGDPDGWRS